MRASRRPWGGIRTFGAETPVLVAVVTRLKDWRLLLDQRWYRIPVRTAPEGLPRARYIAWYQTRPFGREKWAVRWYARVLGIEALKRIELLPDEPHHKNAQKPYYRVRVGDLLRLPHPIPSRRLRRIVFIPTSLERLFLAEEINDLFKTSPIEDRLYAVLRQRGFEPERQFVAREEGVGRMLDMALFCSDGRLDIECDGERYHSGRERAMQDRTRDNALNAAGWHVLRFSGKEILDHTGECMRTVNRAVKRLGGLKKKGPKPEPRV